MKYLFSIIFLWVGLSGLSQNKVYDVVEQQPQYKGGINAMSTFLGQNLVYPEVARQAGITGKVYVQFVINKKGKMENIKVIRSPHESLSKESVRVIKKMPRWKPGVQDGKKVKVRYTLPINFTLSDDTEEEAE